MSTTYSNSSLYVGDLQPDVNEAYLYEIFRQIGPIISIKVCRDALSTKSLGYAYVNFQNAQDAARSIEVLNFAEVKGKPIRIMYVQRDPTIRKSGLGNIFIKNLDKSIDHKALYDTFSFFGNIMSCKVCAKKVEKVGKDGKITIEDESLGYGFVHFETQEAAILAINKVNGMLIEGKKVSVAAFVRRQDRKNISNSSFTNIYIKDLDPSVDVKTLETHFKKFGEITSCFINMDRDTGKSKCFGFLNYKTAEEAKKAVSEMDGKQIEGLTPKGKTLYVSKAEKKEERREKLVKQYESKCLETQAQNLYVKNFDESIDEEKLKQLFEPFGKITSCVVMKDENGVSKGFGFVCFEKPEEAEKALGELRTKMLGSKPLYVNFAQRKESRKTDLEKLHLQRVQGGYRQGQFQMGGPQVVYGGVRSQGQNFSYPNQKPRWGNQRTVKGQGQEKKQGREGKSFDKKKGGQERKKDTQGQEQIKFGPNVRNPKQQTTKPKVQETKQEDTGISSQLANMSPRTQKQTLGDHIYPLILAVQPALASKITGMILEMENGDILHLIESPEALGAKIKEASNALKQFDEKKN